MTDKITAEIKNEHLKEWADEELQVIEDSGEMTADKMIRFLEEMEKEMLEGYFDDLDTERLYVLAHAVSLLKKEEEKEYA